MFDKDPATIVHDQDPFNAGPPPALLAEAPVTPTDRFFVRNHGAVPAPDLATYSLRVGGLVGRPLRLSLADLAGFPRATVAATLQCAGNRRDELLALGPIPDELPWGGEAIGTATWSGARLADVLAAAGVGPGARHVALCGLDAAQKTDGPFGGSIPLERALAPDVLLADTMNGEPLPPVHGAPLRLVVPGYIGARSVKWLAEVELRAGPSDNYFQARAYRLARGAPAPGAMLGELFVNARICTPEAGASVPAGELRVAGYAIGAGLSPLAAVELSADGGASWRPATLLGDAAPGLWQLWEARVILAPGPAELVVRAADRAGNTMPATLAEVWNAKGYMNNALHRVRLAVAP